MMCDTGIVQSLGGTPTPSHLTSILLGGEEKAQDNPKQKLKSNQPGPRCLEEPSVCSHTESKTTQQLERDIKCKRAGKMCSFSRILPVLLCYFWVMVRKAGEAHSSIGMHGGQQRWALSQGMHFPPLLRVSCVWREHLGFSSSRKGQAKLKEKFLTEIQRGAVAAGWWHLLQKDFKGGCLWGKTDRRGISTLLGWFSLGWS